MTSMTSNLSALLAPFHRLPLDEKIVRIRGASIVAKPPEGSCSIQIPYKVNEYAKLYVSETNNTLNWSILSAEAGRLHLRDRELFSAFSGYKFHDDVISTSALNSKKYNMTGNAIIYHYTSYRKLATTTLTDGMIWTNDVKDFCSMIYPFTWNEDFMGRLEVYRYDPDSMFKACDEDYILFCKNILPTYTEAANMYMGAKETAPNYQEILTKYEEAKKTYDGVKNKYIIPDTEAKTLANGLTLPLDLTVLKWISHMICLCMNKTITSEDHALAYYKNRWNAFRSSSRSIVADSVVRAIFPVSEIMEIRRTLDLLPKYKQLLGELIIMNEGSHFAHTLSLMRYASMSTIHLIDLFLETPTKTLCHINAIILKQIRMYWKAKDAIVAQHGSENYSMFKVLNPDDQSLQISQWPDLALASYMYHSIKIGQMPSYNLNLNGISMPRGKFADLLARSITDELMVNVTTREEIGSYVEEIKRLGMKPEASSLQASSCTLDEDVLKDALAILKSTFDRARQANTNQV